MARKSGKESSTLKQPFSLIARKKRPTTMDSMILIFFQMYSKFSDPIQLHCEVPYTWNL